MQITYGEIAMRVEGRAVRDCTARVKDWTSEQRERARNSVGQTLRRTLLKIASGKFNKKTADNFHSDLVLWHVLKGFGS